VLLCDVYPSRNLLLEIEKITRMVTMMQIILSHLSLFRLLLLNFYFINLKQNQKVWALIQH